VPCARFVARRQADHRRLSIDGISSCPLSDKRLENPNGDAAEFRRLFAIGGDPRKVRLAWRFESH